MSFEDVYNHIRNILRRLEALEARLAIPIYTIVQGVDGTKAQVVTLPVSGKTALLTAGGPTDPISDLPVSIPYDHHQLHEGEMFRWSTYVASIGNGVSKDVRVTVPDIPLINNRVTTSPHFRFEFVSTLGGLCYLYEAPTLSAQGTTRTPIAMERNGTYTPNLTIGEDPTVTAVGTLLWQGLLTSSKQNAGSTSNPDAEFILKNNTVYCVRFTSSAANNQVLVRLVWYEDKGV